MAELPEFSMCNLKDRVITISRASGSLTFPASFVLVAALNPCPCGYFGDDRQQCTCSMSMVQRYQKRISGPLMDRIDIHLDVKRMPFQKLSDIANGETSPVIRQRVESARQIQAARFAPLNKPHVLVNGDMGPAEVQMFCELDETGKNLMRAAVQQIITHHGVEVAVLLSYQEYKQLVGASKQAQKTLSQFFRESPLVEAELDFSRDQSEARATLDL